MVWGCRGCCMPLLPVPMLLCTARPRPHTPAMLAMPAGTAAAAPGATGKDTEAAEEEEEEAEEEPASQVREMGQDREPNGHLLHSTASCHAWRMLPPAATASAAATNLPC